MVHAETSVRFEVVVSYGAAPHQVDLVAVTLAVGATVLDAIEASGVLLRHPEIDLGQAKLGVWGKVKQPADPVREGDRVEIYRPLKVDPKEARRQRYQGHKAKLQARNKPA